MEKNIGNTDRFIRILFAVAIIYFIGNQGDTMQIIMAIVAAALTFTALDGVCFLYRPFNLSTRKRKNL